MGLVSLEELPQQSSQFRERGVQVHQRKFLGRASSRTDSPIQILTSRLCPKIGGFDPYDRYAIITDVQAERQDPEDVGYFWHIDMTSTTDYDENDEIHPLQRPADISWDSEQHENYVYVDRNGQPIVTTANTMIPAKVEDSRWVVNISKNLARASPQLLTLNNRINNSAVTVDGITFKKETLMCKQLRFSEMKKETFKRERVFYKTCTFSLHFRPEGWKVKIPNVDLSQLMDYERPVVDPKTGDFKRDKNNKVIRKLMKNQRVKITFGDPPEYPTEPWPLDKRGRPLPDGYDPKDIIVFDKDVYHLASFDALPLK